MNRYIYIYIYVSLSTHTHTHIHTHTHTYTYHTLMESIEYHRELVRSFTSFGLDVVHYDHELDEEPKKKLFMLPKDNNNSTKFLNADFNKLIWSLMYYFMESKHPLTRRIFTKIENSTKKMLEIGLYFIDKDTVDVKLTQSEVMIDIEKMMCHHGAPFTKNDLHTTGYDNAQRIKLQMLLGLELVSRLELRNEIAKILFFHDSQTKEICILSNTAEFDIEKSKFYVEIGYTFYRTPRGNNYTKRENIYSSKYSQ